jgi:hypothetical protein
MRLQRERFGLITYRVRQHIYRTPDGKHQALAAGFSS